jgi:dipeptidyl aminopeptidase/acylaminoacyl peptidase
VKLTGGNAVVRILIGIVIGLAINVAGYTQTPQPPIEAYGDLPKFSNFTISPTGSHVAYIERGAGADVLVVLNRETGDNWAVGIEELKVNQVEWAGPDYVIVGAFEAIRFSGQTRKANYTGAYSINIETRKITALLAGNTAGLYANQTGIGRIVGLSDEAGYVYMPAFSSSGDSAVYSLYKVSLETGRGRIVSRGRNQVIDYVVAPNGTILAEETYSNRTDDYKIRTRQSGEWETIFEQDSPEGPRGLVGAMPDGSGLVYFSRSQNGFNALYKMDFTGEFSSAIMAREATEINRVMVDANRTIVGVEYGGLTPSYEFFDADLTAEIAAIQEQVGTATVRLQSWTKDWTKLVLYIEGTNYAGDYILLDRASGELLRLARSRPDIPKDAIGELLTIEYKARDGLSIPALLTIPRGAEIENLPLIVMPHGGPENHDQVGFHYMAQYFANRGYLVFQPNFRGSDGFGTEFTEAGYGGWGSTMQHDITDGVHALINGGQADPARICIVGWSYGGYAALAGGAFTPDLYQCVASIAGVSDLPRILVDERRDHGRNHWVVEYWEDVMANGDASRDTLREKSPAMYAENFQAPVLLMHGREDLTVKINQSRRMRKALNRVDHPVELIEYRGGDHSLLSPGDRLNALQELDKFVSTHIGSN